jgi:hypothetical protein
MRGLPLTKGQLRQSFVAELIGRHVFDDFAQVAQFACGIDEAWFFFAGIAVTHEFHNKSFIKKVKEK